MTTRARKATEADPREDDERDDTQNVAESTGEGARSASTGSSNRGVGTGMSEVHSGSPSAVNSGLDGVRFG